MCVCVCVCRCLRSWVVYMCKWGDGRCECRCLRSWGACMCVSVCVCVAYAGACTQGVHVCVTGWEVCMQVPAPMGCAYVCEGVGHVCVGKGEGGGGGV